MTGPAPVIVSFPAPTKQARATVGIRLILIVPQLIMLCLLGAVTGVVVFLGWLAALCTGQMPPWAQSFATGFLRWSTRVHAYFFLLTDRYPPFAMEESDYPVRLFTKPTRLNRLAVLFRALLMVPAGLLAGLALTGLVILSPIAWLITLVAGRMPQPAYQAAAAIIRFSARYSGYGYLLSPEYPAGLFGDKPQSAAEAVPPTEADLGSPPSATSAPWRLDLSGVAKGLVCAAITVGLVAIVGGTTALVTSANNLSARTAAFDQVTRDYTQLDRAFVHFLATISDCQQLSCLVAQDSIVAQALRTFDAQLQDASIPSAFSAQENVLLEDTVALATDFQQLASAQSMNQYESIASGLSLQGDIDQLQSDFVRLRESLAS